MDELGKRVTVAIRIRPKILTARNATQVAERYHPDACTKVGDSTIRLADTAMVAGAVPLPDNMSAGSGKEGRMNSFSFDYVFDQDSNQLEVYEETALDAVDAALSAGCNATIMTYGQTGSGKTYTVLGAVGNNPLSNEYVTPDTGLFLRVLKDILSYAEARKDKAHVVVGLTVTEVYLDTVRDLLAPLQGGDAPALKVVIVEDNTRIPDVTNRPITEVRDAVAAYRTATNRRVCRATEANDQSSRSHAIFTIDIYQQRRVADLNPEPLSLDELVQFRDAAPMTSSKPKAGAGAGSSGAAAKPKAKKDPSAAGGGVTPPGSPSAQSQDPLPKNAPPFDLTLASNPLIKVGSGLPPVVLSRIVLTDLAGSEKLKHSKAKGDALEEMKKINGSLTALGNVVHALFSGSKHVPYRDSRLTVMLRTTFSTPNSRIVLIANCAPTALTFDETLSTMFFADKVKAMKVDDATGASGAKAALAMQLEADVLRLSKDMAELTGDMRILRGAYYNHRPSLRAGLLRMAKLSSGGGNGFDVLGSYRPAHGARTSTANKQTKVALKQVEEECATATEARKRSDNASFEQQLRDEHASLLANLVTTHKDSMARAKEYMRTNEAQSKALAAELDATAVTLQQDIGTVEGELNAFIASNDAIHERAAALKPSWKALKKEDNALTAQLEGVQRAFLDKDKDQQSEWDNSTLGFAKLTTEHEQQSRFYDAYMAYLKERIRYFDGARAVEEEHAEVFEARKELEHFDVSQWIRRALLVMANNAVIRSNNALRAPRVPKSRPAPLNGAPDGSGKVPKGPPRTRSMHADPNAKGRLRASTPFDQSGLLGQIRTYMDTGCTLLMYGKRGSPHFRFFFTNDGGTPEAPEATRLHWCKDEMERDGPEVALENSVILSTVYRVTLGKTVGMFPSLSRGSDANRPATEDDDYYTSFTVHYLRDGREPKSLCITTESKAEMEAWVIGVCDISHVNPEFGELMQLRDVVKGGGGVGGGDEQLASVSAPVAVPPAAEFRPSSTGLREVRDEDGNVLSNALLGRPAYAHLVAYCSTDLEVQLCEQWHVPPKVWLGCRVRVQMMSPKGGPLIQLTPGEVRQLFPQLDIFRANAVWELLAQLGLLERSPDSISYLTFSSE